MPLRLTVDLHCEGCGANLIGAEVRRDSTCASCGLAISESFNAPQNAPLVAIQASVWFNAVAVRTGHPVEAIQFVHTVLTRVLKAFGAEGPNPRHIDGKIVSDAFRDHLLEHETDLEGARKALGRWGIRRSDDLGGIVFAMVDAGLMSKSPDDSPADFEGLWTLDTLFPNLAPQPYSRDYRPPPSFLRRNPLGGSTSILCCIAALLVCILWMRSDVGDLWANMRTGTMIVSAKGSIALTTLKHDDASTSSFRLGDWQHLRVNGDISAPAAENEWSWRRLGFVKEDSPGLSAVGIPYWLTLIPLMVLPVRYAIQFCRFHYRYAHGLCLHCGFDLRHTPERCPECGKPPVARSSVATSS